MNDDEPIRLPQPVCRYMPDVPPFDQVGVPPGWMWEMRIVPIYDDKESDKLVARRFELTLSRIIREAPAGAP